MKFQQKLQNTIKKNNSLVCVGLDTDIEKIPKHLLTASDAVTRFNKAIIDATTDLVCAYKLNIAFYEAGGIEGLKSLKKTIDYIHNQYTGIPVILDAKRGDIGNSAFMYAKSVFEYWKADAVTLHLFTGRDGIEPFLQYKNHFSFVYLRSTNPSASDFQDIDVNGKPFYLVMAEKVNKWPESNFGIIGAATYTSELKSLRDIFPDRIFLVPGIDAQKGDLKETLTYGLTKDKSGLIASSSRGIIYASNDKNFAKIAREKTEKMQNIINKYRL